MYIHSFIFVQVNVITLPSQQEVTGLFCWQRFDKTTEFMPWTSYYHDDVIKWTHFPRYWPFVRGIHRSSVNSPHKGQWRGALMFSFICARIHDWVNNGEAGDLRRHRAHYDVIVMTSITCVGALTQPCPNFTGETAGEVRTWLSN